MSTTILNNNNNNKYEINQLTSKTIPDTPWSIVLTNQNHEFYYHNESKESVWEMPDDIADLLGQLVALGLSSQEPIHDDYDQDEDNFIDDQEVEIEDQIDDKVGEDQEEHLNEEDAQIEKMEITDLTILTSSKALDEELEKEEAQKEEQVKPKPPSSPPKIPLQDQKRQFMELLNENNVSPFSYWKSEREKYLNDSRLKVVAKEKDQLYFFDEYCRLKSEEFSKTQKQQEQKLRKIFGTPEDAFQTLLDQQVKKLTEWSLFSRRFARDKRFLALSRTEREAMFRAHVKQLKEGQGKQKNGLKNGSSPSNTVKKGSSSVAESSSAEKRKREQDSLREREEKVRKEMRTIERERNLKKRALEEGEATVVFQDLLRLFAKVNESYNTMMEKSNIKTHSQYPLSSNLKTSEKQALHLQYTKHVFENTTLKYFKSFLQSSSSVHSNQDWSQTWFTLQNQPFVEKLPFYLLERHYHSLEDTWEELYHQHYSTRKHSAFQNFQKALQEDTFIRFSVKQAVQDLTAKLQEEEKRLPQDKEVWEYIDIREFEQVLEKDKRYVDCMFDETKRRQMLTDHVEKLIQEAKAEKGGTVDKTIALATRRK